MKRLIPKLLLALALSVSVFTSADASLFLRQSTASQAIKAGPFVDSTDGNTEETALTIANTDVKCSKNGGTLASKNSGGGTHDANGWYTLTFDATDTNTVGRFQCFIHVAGALPVTFDANIVEEVVYDRDYAASGTGIIGTAQTGDSFARIGTNGGGLTAVPWNASWDAEVQSEVDDGLKALFLDRLFATDYDPASKPGVAGAWINELSENDAGSIRYTSEALEQAPTAGGGNITQIEGVDATDTIDARIAAANILRPTTAGRTLDVTATGEAGIDWANVGSPTTTVNLSGTTISTSQAVASVSGAVGSVSTGGITNASFACTGGSFLILGVVDCGTAQSASSTGVVLRSAAALADDTANGMTLLVNGSTQGYAQSRAATDYVGSSDTATVDTWTVTPSGTITYYLFGTAPFSGGGSGLDASGVRAAVGLATANLDTQLAALQSDTDNIQTRLPTSLVSGRMDASVGAYQSGLTPLQPTTAGRTLDVTTTGEAGIDWANVGGQSTTVTLSGTTISAVSGSVGGNVTGSIGSLATQAKADVNAEADTALSDIHLNRLFATAYDPASKPGNASGLLNVLVENDGGVPRYTANALENGPSGGGGGTNITQIEGVDATDTIDARIAAAGLSTASALTTVGTNVSTALTRIGTPVGTSISADIAGVESGISWNAAWDAEVESEVQDALNVYDPPTRAELTSDVAGLLTSQRILTGTCSSGSTTTCVDAALTQAAAAQLQDRLVCFDDSWCGMITTFNPATDTVTTTKVAPSTRSARAYTIFPSTAL